MKRLTEHTFIGRMLAWLAQAVLRHRRWLLYPQLVLFALSVLYTVRFLQFDTSRDNLVGAKKKYHQNFLAYKKEFDTQDDMVVVVESESPERNRDFVERLGAKLVVQTNLFRDVFYKGDLKALGPKALLFVPQTNLVELLKALQDFRPFIDRFAGTSNLVSLFEMINNEFLHAEQEENAQNDTMMKSLPALGQILAEARFCLERPGTAPAPGVTALFNPGDPGDEGGQEGYVAFDKGRIYLLTAQALRAELNDQAVERLRALVEETQAEVPGLNVGLTGESVLEHDEMAQSQKDTVVASIASLILCALIFIYGYQETGRPVKATLCLIVGLGYTLAFATLTIGHLNILTITFVPILIGLAIDYGVHLIARYEEELRHGRTEEAALTRAMVYTGQGIFTGAFTTAGAFLAMYLTDFKGIQEMGVICGGGLLICLVPMLTMLPVLLLRGRQNVIDHEKGDPYERRRRIENIWLQRPVGVTVLTLVLCGLAMSQVHKVYFDYNLLHMQSAGLPAVQTEEKLIRSTPKSVLFGVVVATNLEQAVELEQRIVKLPAVSGVESISGFLTEDQREKLELVGQIKQELSSLRFATPDPRPVNLQELSCTLYSFGGFLHLAEDAVKDEKPALYKELSGMSQTVLAFRKQMLDGDAAQVATNALKLAAFQQALLGDARETFDALRTQDNSAPLRVEDLPLWMRHRFVGVTGKFLIMVYPKRDLWQRPNQKEFIDQLRDPMIDPNVTGTPVQLYEYTTLLKDSYVEAAWYSLGAIALLVLAHFRNLASVFLALIPVGIGSLWLGGVMGAFDLPLNPANIMTLPLVIGIGVTNGIHILNRFAEEQTPSILARSTGKAVLVSGLTTIAGFGSLALGRHQGIQSLGYVMATGLATCMVAALTFLPALLTLWLRRKPAPEKSTQCRQCTIDTGSGGTEVKTSITRVK